jgi:hypothetical protein
MRRSVERTNNIRIDCRYMLKQIIIDLKCVFSSQILQRVMPPRSSTARVIQQRIVALVWQRFVTERKTVSHQSTTEHNVVSVIHYALRCIKIQNNVTQSHAESRWMIEPYIGALVDPNFVLSFSDFSEVIIILTVDSNQSDTSNSL